MTTVDRRVLMMGVTAAGATLVVRPAAAQNFLPDFQETLQLVGDPTNASLLELEFRLFATLVVEVLYQTGELAKKDAAEHKSLMFNDEFYPRRLFSALANADEQRAIASAMEEADAQPIDDQIRDGVGKLAERLADQGIDPDSPVIAKALASPVHVARIAPYLADAGLSAAFDPCKIWVIGLICRL